MSGFNPTFATVVANLIGGLIFFWIDRFIFRNTSRVPLWEIKEEAMCADCGKIGVGYRVVEWRGYNRQKCKNVQFRCENCRKEKLERIRPLR
jgi:hypothetical protein